jgi:hypothetical protein
MKIFDQDLNDWIDRFYRGLYSKVILGMIIIVHEEGDELYRRALYIIIDEFEEG